MAHTREGGAQRIVQRFHDAILLKESTWREYLRNPNPRTLKNKEDALRRYNMLRGTLMKLVMATTLEL